MCGGDVVGFPVGGRSVLRGGEWREQGGLCLGREVKTTPPS